VSEIDLDSLDWSKMVANTYRLQPRQDARDLFPIIFAYKEFHEKLHDIDTLKVLKYIPLVYDKNSPLHKEYPELNKLKIKAADIAGFIRQDNGKFLSNVEEMLDGSNEIVNKMIIRYCLLQKSALYTRYVVLNEVYAREINGLLQGKKSKIEEFTKIADELDNVRQQLLSKDTSEKLKTDFEKFYFDDQLKLRPEDIAYALKKKIDPVPVPEKKKPIRASSQLVTKYESEDEYCVLNEDKSLHPIYIKLPQCPDRTLVEGYGKKKEDQKFNYAEIPLRLEKIIEKSETIDGIWEFLENNYMAYIEEIKWIQEQWYYLLNGYWFYNFGKPTYIDGWHYGYLNFWQFAGGIRPEYRDRDRKQYHGLRYAYTTTLVPEVTADGRFVYEDDDKRILKMNNVGRRVFMGYTGPKHRRAGDSNKFLCALYFETITRTGANSGIISMTGDHAKKKLFDEILVSGWQQMIFIFKPRTTANENPDKEIKFIQRKQATSARITQQLKSKMDYSPTSASNYYDGGKSFWLLVDETGKTVENEPFERHQQLKECMSQGAGIKIGGFMGYPSTVGEMKGIGGSGYFRICQNSKFEKRDIAGQTNTGLMLIYMSAYEGLEGFVDEYGYSVIEKPTPRQEAFIGKNFGSKEFIKNKRQHYLDINDFDGYNEFVRLFPVEYLECFRTEDGDIGFNTKILNERLDELALIEHEFIRVGYFEFEGEKYNSKVKWIDNPKGRFKISQKLHDTQSNQYTIGFVNGEMQRFPKNPRHTLSCDPFKQEKVRSGRMSDGGIAVFYDYDQEVDEGVDVHNWKSHRFVLTYRYRHLKTAAFYDDVIMAAQYFNALVYPEINVADIIRHFEEAGFAGYFKYDIDRITGKYKATPGFITQGKEKQNLFNSQRDYIEVHGHRERHSDYLFECKEIQSMEELTDFDLFTATGGCLLGTRNKMARIIKLRQQPMSLSKMYSKKRYR